MVSSAIPISFSTYHSTHATHRLEGSHLDACILRVGVIHSGAAVGTVEADVGNLRNSFEGAVARFEIHNRCPIVGEVLRESARGASAFLANVAGHCCVERILVCSSARSLYRACIEQTHASSNLWQYLVNDRTVR